MGKLYITIENDIITGVHCTDNVKQLQGLHPKAKVSEVDESFSGHTGESVEYFNKDFTRKIILGIKK